MLVKRICDVCEGRGRFESCFMGGGMACLTCKGSGEVMMPDDAVCRALLDAVMAEYEMQIDGGSDEDTRQCVRHEK
jgi:hypothetical protein